MTNPETPRRVHHDLSIQQVGRETLVYDERAHKAYCLNEISSVLWRLADGGHTIAQMSAAASLELGASVSEALVLFAMEELRRDDLVEPLTPAEDGVTVSRRAMLQQLTVSGAMLLPVVAAIVAPTAAQAYSGCIDCSDTPSIQSAQLARARARNQQLNGASPLISVPSSTASPAFSQYTSPGIGPSISIDPKLQP